MLLFNEKVVLSRKPRDATYTSILRLLPRFRKSEMYITSRGPPWQSLQ